MKNQSNKKYPLKISADSAIGSTDKNTSVFKGNVHVNQGKQEIWSDYMTYDKKTRHLYAKGNALLQRPDLRMAANEISYNLEKKHPRRDTHG